MQLGNGSWEMVEKLSSLTACSGCSGVLSTLQGRTSAKGPLASFVLVCLAPACASFCIIAI